MKRLFVDTAGWMACADAADPSHTRASAARDRWLEQKGVLVTTDYVIANHKLLNEVRAPDKSVGVWGFAPDNKRVITWHNGRFELWNWDSRTFESPMPPPVGGNHISVFSQNHRYVADRSTIDPYIRIWEFNSGNVVCKFKEAPGVSVTAMAFSPDGSYLGTALDRKTDYIALWKIPNDLKELISKPNPPPIETVESENRVEATAQAEKKSAPANQPEKPGNEAASTAEVPLPTIQSPKSIGQVDPRIGKAIQKNPAWPIIQRAIEAHGGLENILHASVTRTKMKVQSPDTGRSYLGTEVTAYYKYPNQIREEYSIHLQHGMLNKVIVYSDGNLSILENGKPGSVTEALRTSVRQYVFERDVESFRALLDDKFSVSLGPDAILGNTHCPSITVTSADNYVISLVFDSDSAHLIRCRRKSTDEFGKEFDSEQIYSHFAFFPGGLVRPRDTELYNTGKLSFQSDILEFTTLPDLASVYFTDPSATVPQ